jgi:uncharacterized membrane protein
MKFLGHPLHTMIIHFPTALLPMDLVLCVLGYHYHQPSFSEAAHYCLFGGVASGILALLSGIIDLLRLPKENKPAVSTGITHGLINGSILLIYILIAFKALKSYPEITQVTPAMLWMKGILVAGLFVGNYFGGKLIYRYHIGIVSK